MFGERWLAKVKASHALVFSFVGPETKIQSCNSNTSWLWRSVVGTGWWSAMVSTLGSRIEDTLGYLKNRCVIISHNSPRCRWNHDFRWGKIPRWIFKSAQQNATKHFNQTKREDVTTTWPFPISWWLTMQAKQYQKYFIAKQFGIINTFCSPVFLPLHVNGV